MQVQIRHQPSFAVARLLLAPGEPAQVEAGAMLATSYGMHIQSSSQGGVMKGLGRAFLSGESFFISTHTARRTAAGWTWRRTCRETSSSSTWTAEPAGA
jgi:uncharacterized protein (AIM24 family)